VTLTTAETRTKTDEARPRVLIEDWLPAAAIGVECIRERSTGQQPPDKRLHVWWARRPLTVSRAAVLGSLVPADFPRDVFERLLGFNGSSEEILRAQERLDWARQTGTRVPNPHGQRAFRRPLRTDDLERAHEAVRRQWNGPVSVIDPMAGGGSIPLESARLGFHTLANEYNPVACSILEATVDYPFRFGPKLAERARYWGAKLRKRFVARMERFYPKTGTVPPHCYIFARTVPCPDTSHPTPLVPDWHLLKPASHSGCGSSCLFAVPVVDKARGVWRVQIRRFGHGAGEVSSAPRPTYDDGKGISLFTGLQIPSEYIKAKAQAGEMKSALYAVALKTPQGLEFRPPEAADLRALEEAERELARLWPGWEKANVIPTELYPEISSDERPRLYGMPRWADMFSSRQLLAMGILVEELRKLRSEIVKEEGEELGAAVEHLLALAIDKQGNHNCSSTRWENTRGVVKGKMDRHDYAFKSSFAEMATCNSGGGLDWAIDNVIEAYEELSRLPQSPHPAAAELTLGTATNLPQYDDKSLTAVVVDPPYADNVQYSELADFFYVWLKRTQGHHHPEWFSTYLCEHDQEAVVNVSRFREDQKSGKKKGSAKEAREKAQAFYQGLMTEVFKEAHRVLRDDGVLTVMFTHKKQEAWTSLFTSLIDAGFTITATWPVKTESEHSLHQAKKNAAQSTVILVARKRRPNAGLGYFNAAMITEIRDRARATAERLKGEGLNAVDQLVGAFGPAMTVFSRYDEVRTDTGEPVGVDQAIDEAADAVSAWRIEQLAARGLDGVEPEGQFALLCWDVLGAAEFRFNEASLLGKAVGMDVDRLIAAGLVAKKGENVRMLSARERRREKPLENAEVMETLFGSVPVAKRGTKAEALRIHPNDPRFRTALDACQALALRYVEAHGGSGGIGSARALARQQGWTKDSPVARLMEALVIAAPPGVRHDQGEKSTAARFPEFRAWHALLQPLFGITPLDWTEQPPLQAAIPALEAQLAVEDQADDDTENEDEDEGEED